MSHHICKYHGRECATPGWCKNNRPHKYEGDGYEEHIDPDRLTIGNVVRLKQPSGGLPTFTDSVVIGIKVQYGTARRKETKQEQLHFNTLAEALAHATPNDYTILVLARPYLSACNAFGSMPNYMMGAEKYEVYGNHLERFMVVVLASGAYAHHMTSPLLHKWEVVVKSEHPEVWPKGGKVYDDLSEGGARESFKLHRQMAQGAYGRKGGETVQLLCDGQLVEEYVGGM